MLIVRDAPFDRIKIDDAGVTCKERIDPPPVTMSVPATQWTPQMHTSRRESLGYPADETF